MRNDVKWKRKKCGIICEPFPLGFQNHLLLWVKVRIQLLVLCINFQHTKALLWNWATITRYTLTVLSNMWRAGIQSRYVFIHDVTSYHIEDKKNVWLPLAFENSCSCERRGSPPLTNSVPSGLVNSETEIRISENLHF